MTAEPDEALIAGAERLFERPWRFLKSAPELEFLPPADKIEVAFAGRSNVGKSSLINALLRQNGIARTSNTPGRTQELNFFETDDVPLYVVDMPGYGFAKAPKEKVDSWNELISGYLRGRPTLARVFVLVDARHGLKPHDLDVMAMLDEAAVSYQLVLTKADKVKPTELDALIKTTSTALAKHAAAFPFLLATSAEKGQGISDLRLAIATILAERT